MFNFLKTLAIVSTVFSVSLEQQLLLKSRNDHLSQTLSNREIKALAELSNTSHIDEILDNILIPRVVNTTNHERVYRYIVKELRRHGWNVQVDEFQDNAPIFGTLTFKNIIGTLNPNADRFLVLACHYDSKYFADNNFVGATDSAVPCAMMLNLAKVMKRQLEKVKNNTDVSLKFLFFDGEEAFLEWNSRDSIYGARHLANKMHRTQIRTSLGETVSDLTRMDMLMLLDLIGARNPKFYSFYQETERWYLKLVEAEERLASLGLLKHYNALNPQHTIFVRRSSNAGVEDDHLPFLRKGVPIVHLITIPFPREWHTPQDNRDIVDIDTVENINKILRVFVAEYLHLSVKK